MRFVRLLLTVVAITAVTACSATDLTGPRNDLCPTMGSDGC